MRFSGGTLERWNAKSRSFASLRMTTREAQNDRLKRRTELSLVCLFRSTVPPFYRSTVCRPHVGQNFQPTSSSEPHAGQFIVVTFCPQ
jgi:hypothetical protein